MNNYGEIDSEYMSDIISDYVAEKECDNDMNCKGCKFIEECYSKASNRCNSEFAESINYGGYNTEKEFWEQLFD